ncbi:MAG: dihydroneopterin aldolase [Selenomonadaceae bacterium]|nr:dihydroneopterin aldolase [Selenomonadaceae bacterium]MBQ6131834.1 dihydroneopterin aldolase [Selenomonadaceae bacterium]MBQ7492980.1 dihydroneopterin aldolase [Selenomonadaceae bacterium]
MADKIILKGLEIMGRHGCSEEERKHEQPFIVDAELYLDLERASKTDDLGDSIDYAQVLTDIKKIVGGTSRNLIETVAQDICDFLMRKYLLLDGVKIILRKPEPPVEEKFAGAAVEIERTRTR